MSLANRTPPTAEEFQQYYRRFNNWSRWGSDDELGTLNHITPEVRRAAAALIREGQTISLARPLATSQVLPGHRNPQPADHRVNVGDGGCSDYVGVSYHGFANTHIDALCHIFTNDRRMYGGRPADAVTAGGARFNSIDRWQGGVFTRGVLYDVVRHREAPHVTADTPVHGWELEDIARASAIEPRAGDAVLVRMGAQAFWAAQPGFEPAWQAPGLHASSLEFLYEYDAALLGWDLMEAPGQDAYSAPSLPIHSVGIPYMGLALLDNADLDLLAAACEAAGRWEFLFIASPLVIMGGTGSPANPLAVL